MIVDSSALLAINLDEPEAFRFGAAIAAGDGPRMPAPNWVEVALVMHSRVGALLRDCFKAYVGRMGLTIAPFLETHAVAAGHAWVQFGRGQHPAKLNFGDCMAYGFAKIEGEPLLFKGNDFSQTDIEPALKD